MVVYIEYVILDNFVFTALICGVSYMLLREKVKKARCIFASVLGTACALVYPFIKSAAIVLSFKAALCVAMCLILFLDKRKKFVKRSLTFLLATAIVGGAQFMIGFFVHGDASAALRLPISDLPLSIYFLPPLLMIPILKSFLARLNAHRLKENYIYEMVLKMGNKSRRMRGLVDTGNQASNGKDVIFVGTLTAFDLLGGEYITLMDRCENSMVIHTAAGDKKIILLSGQIELYLDKDEHIFMDVQVGIGDIGRSGDYEAILPLSILGKEKVS